VKVDRAEVRALIKGLRATPPRIPARYFYDGTGSQLFDLITQTPEYYPTRTELSILEQRGARIAACVGKEVALIELGCGSADKALALIGHLSSPSVYRPIDISCDALERTTSAVRKSYPALAVSPFWGDFMEDAAYADLPEAARRLVYYSGSTIGNFDPHEAIGFLRCLRDRLSRGDQLLLAVDLVKDVGLLNAAYNDAAGVTAAFNRNVLAHLNARFGGDFEPDAFEHRAFYQPEKRRVEMHLVPRANISVTLGGERLDFAPERAIHTENSYKFTIDDLRLLARQSGYAIEEMVTDERAWFAVAILRA